MSQSQEIIAICPECNDKTIYEGHAKRPRITCSECHTRFYISTPKTQPIPKSNPKQPPQVEGLATPPTVILEDIDTIKEMERTIQLIKDPDKRATQLSRLHAMKLKPIVNKNKISLKEMFDSAGS